MREPNYLFSTGDLSATLDAQRATALKAIAAIQTDRFLGTTIDTLVEHYASEYLVEPLQVDESGINMAQDEAKIDVTGRFEYGGSRDGRPVHANGHTLTFYIPFSGDVNLWHLKPNIWFSWMPSAELDSRSSCLVIKLTNTSNTEPQWYRQELDRQLKSIRELVAAQTAMLSQFNAQLPNEIRNAITRRRAEIEKLQGLAAAFDFPLVKKPGMPDFRPIEVARRNIKPLPRPASTGYKAEPAIADELYDQLLALIRHAGATYEGAPQTFLSLGEEGLRDIILSHINATFEGRATGETFRKYGKTDIRLEEESRAAFVAECKLWGGEKVLTEALTQLLGYLTWRDSKTALVVFNKGVAGFAAIQELIPTALKAHPNFLREKPAGVAGEWRYVFSSGEDDGREVTVHVFAFNLFVAAARASKRR